MADRVGIKRHLQDLQQSCCARNRKVLEAVAVECVLAEVLLLSKGFANNADGSDPIHWAYACWMESNARCA